MESNFVLLLFLITCSCEKSIELKRWEDDGEIGKEEDRRGEILEKRVISALN